jgi:hypothetical protein
MITAPARAIDQFHVIATSMVQRSIGIKKKHKQDVIAFVNTVTQFIHRGSYAHIVTVITEEVFVNLSVRKIIYDYMYLVDLENNERSCEYSAIQYVAKSIATCKKNPYIINQNHIFSKNYCEVISG